MKYESVRDIIDGIYEAALDDRQWLNVVQKVRATTNSAYGVMASLGTIKSNVKIMGNKFFHYDGEEI